MIYDLRSRHELTFALLDEIRSWRERLVCELLVGDSDHVRWTSSYQVRLPTDLLTSIEPEVTSDDSIRLVLPLTIRHKELLLGVELQGPEGAPCALLLREDSSEIQVEYLNHVVQDVDLHQRFASLEALWLGICRYTPGEWIYWLEDRKAQVDALVSYLTADLTFQVRHDHVAGWLTALDPARRLLIDVLGDPPSEISAAECILLAIPFMPARPSDATDIHTLVAEFAAAVPQLPVEAQGVLAEYGQRWEVLVDVVVPVGRACQVKIAEQRPWTGSPSRVLEQIVPFGDARTTHIEIRAEDQAIELHAPRILDLNGTELGPSAGDAKRVTPDAVAIYASDPDRPFFTKVRIEARVRLLQQLLLIGLLLMNLAATVVVSRIPKTHPNLEDALALLTFPATLAAAVVLARESSPLAVRLLQKWRYALGLSVLALWAATIWKLEHLWL